jgi:hypothetical protein
MALYCVREAFEALEGLSFPATKEQIINYALGHGAQESVVVAFNQLASNVVFLDIGAICENVSIACTLDVYRALEGVPFPLQKDGLLSYALEKDGTPAALAALAELPEGHSYGDIAEVCGSVTFHEG